MIKIEFPDGSIKEFDAGISGKAIAESIGERLAMAALAVKVNGTTTENSTPVTEDSKIEILTFKQEEGKKIFWHSAAHVMAMAVKELYPEVKLTIGPSIDNGFYYDFEAEPFRPEDLEKIQVKMKEIVEKNIPFVKKEVSLDEAKEMFKDNKFKLELIEEYKENLSVYCNKDFCDLCKGPHVPSTGYIKAFKLTNISSSYWKGNAKNANLQRIYGTAFPDKKELKKYLKMVEEAKERDHNKLGKEMQLFMTHEKVGQGLPLLMPKGAKIFQTLQRFVEDEEEKRGYIFTKTPLMAKSDLYKTSGHWDHYKDGMFVMETKGETLALRPMTCPFQFLIYNSKKRSYRELPIRYAETSTLFRNEDSGEMHGLIRLRQFTISEGHLICRPDQLKDEFKGVIDLIKFIMKTIGLEEDLWYRFSKWDPEDKEKYIDNPPAWDESQKVMKEILDELKLDYVEAKGEAAFYGPKLDIQAKNVYGKEDTIITIQIDLALPERFNMVYTDKDSKEKRPIVIHRTSIGCYERTIAMLIEKYAGKFPLWLNPNQVIILPVADRFKEYANKVAESFKEVGIRVEVDDRTETIGRKVRDAELQRFNFILVVGEKEIKDDTVAVRTRDNNVEGAIDYKKFQERVLQEIKEKK